MKGIQGDPHTTTTKQIESHSNVKPKEDMKTIQPVTGAKVSIPKGSTVKGIPKT